MLLFEYRLTRPHGGAKLCRDFPLRAAYAYVWQMQGDLVGTQRGPASY